MDGWAYSLGTCVTLWAACVVYLLPLEKRTRPRLRIALMLAAGLAAAAVMTGLHCGGWSILLVNFGLAVAFFLVCGQMTAAPAIYCAVWAQVSQQLAAETAGQLYWTVSGCLGWGEALWAAGAFLLFAAAYGALALTISRWMPIDGKYVVGPRQLTLAVLFLLIFEVLCWQLEGDAAGRLFPVSILMAQYYCATMLYLQYTLFSKSAIKQELAILNRLWYEQKEQYRLTRENIAIINRKCHDLKHQIAAMRTVMNRENQEKYLEEIENSVRIYDAIFKTGNEVLDTVLTEKSLYCEANNIRITCVADGRQLSFIDPVDLYTILGNALDNAIESVERLKDPEMRMIDVLICAERQFLILQITNPLAEPLRFEDGLPVSTKPHDGYHGFGLKSIRHTAGKYGGYTTVRTDGGQFRLKMLIPLEERA